MTYLKGFIEKMREGGYNNIKIIDNASTYPPLLEYYSTIPFEVFRLKENEGHMVFWENDIFEKYRHDLYVVTDPDISIIEECPDNYLELFFSI